MVMNFVKIVLPTGFEHILETLEDGTPNYEVYSSSVNTQNSLKAAYDAGEWEPYDPPQPETGEVEYGPKGFKVALMSDPLFLQWQQDLPPIQREDMKMAAMMDNWPVAQAIYSRLKGVIAQPPGAAAQWQALAEAHNIPLQF